MTPDFVYPALRVEVSKKYGDGIRIHELDLIGGADVSSHVVT